MQDHSKFGDSSFVSQGLYLLRSVTNTNRKFSEFIFIKKFEFLFLFGKVFVIQFYNNKKCLSYSFHWEFFIYRNCMVKNFCQPGSLLEKINIGFRISKQRCTKNVTLVSQTIFVSYVQILCF